MSKSWTFLLATILTSIIVSGCGSNEKPTEADENANATEDNNVEVEDTKEEEVEEPATTASNTSDFSELIKYMEEETEGTTKVLYGRNAARLQL